MLRKQADQRLHILRQIKLKNIKTEVNFIPFKEYEVTMYLHQLYLCQVRVTGNYSIFIAVRWQHSVTPGHDKYEVKITYVQYYLYGMYSLRTFVRFQADMCKYKFVFISKIYFSLLFTNCTVLTATFVLVNSIINRVEIQLLNDESMYLDNFFVLYNKRPVAFRKT